MTTTTTQVQGAARKHRAVSLSAFSIIELVLVLAIIATIAAIAAPRYGAASGRYQTHAAAVRVANDLIATRDQAVAMSGTTSIAYTDKDANYKISLPSGSTSVSLAESPYKALITGPDFGGTGTITFNAWGAPSAGGSLVVTGSGVRFTVSVEAGSGRVSVSAPIVGARGADPKEIVVVPPK